MIQDIPFGIHAKCEAAKKPENKSRNRFLNIIACEYDVRSYTHKIYVICLIHEHILITGVLLVFNHSI